MQDLKLPLFRTLVVVFIIGFHAFEQSYFFHQDLSLVACLCHKDISIFVVLLGNSLDFTFPTLEVTNQWSVAPVCI